MGSKDTQTTDPAAIPAITEPREGLPSGEASATEAATSTTAEAETVTFDDVKFHLVNGAIYHGARMHFLDRLHRWMMFAIIAFGAATMAAVSRPFGISPEWLALISTLIGAANIAFSFSVRARDHDYNRRRCYELLARLTEGRADPNMPTRIHCEMLRLTASEAPPLRALDAIAYNAALDGLGRDKTDRIPIRWYESLLRHLYPFNGTDFAGRTA